MKRLSFIFTLIFVFVIMGQSFAFALSAPVYATSVELYDPLYVTNSKNILLSSGVKAPYTENAYLLSGIPTQTIGKTASANNIMLPSDSMKNSGEKTVVEFDAYFSLTNQGFSIRTQHYTSSGGNSGTSKSVTFVSGEDMTINEWHRIALEMTYDKTSNSTTYKTFVDGELSASSVLEASYAPRMTRIIPYAPSTTVEFKGYFKNPLVYNCASSYNYATNYKYIYADIETDTTDITVDNEKNTVSGIRSTLSVSEVKKLFFASNLSSLRIYGKSDNINPKADTDTVSEGDILVSESTDGLIKVYTINTTDGLNISYVTLYNPLYVTNSKGIILENGVNAPYRDSAHLLSGTPTETIGKTSSVNNIMLPSDSMKNSGEKTVVEFDAYFSATNQGFSIRTQHYTSTGGNSGTSKSVTFISGTDFSINEWHKLALEMSYDKASNATTYKTFADGRLLATSVLETSYAPRMTRIIPYAPSKTVEFKGYFKNPYVFNCSSYYDYVSEYAYEKSFVIPKVSGLTVNNTDMTISNVPSDYSVKVVKVLFDADDLSSVRIYNKDDIINPKDNNKLISDGDILVCENTDGLITIYTISTSGNELVFDFNVIDSYAGGEAFSLTSPVTDIASYGMGVPSPGKSESDTSYRIYGATGGNDDLIQSNGLKNVFRLVSGKKDVLVNYDKLVVEFDAYAHVKDYGFTDFGVALRSAFYSVDLTDEAAGNHMPVKSIANLDFSGNKWHKFVIEYDYSDLNANSGTYKVYLDGEIVSTGENGAGLFIPSRISVSPYANLYFTDFDVYFDNFRTYCTNIGYIPIEKTSFVEGVYEDIVLYEDEKVISGIPSDTTVGEFIENITIVNKKYVSVYPYKAPLKERESAEYISDGDTLCLVSDDGIVTTYTLSLKKDNGMEIIFDNEKPGFAGGTICVRTAEDAELSFYWGDEDGKLDNFTYLIEANVKKGYTNFIDIYKYTAIPEGAIKLLAYSGEELIYSFDIPKSKIFDYKREVYSFGVMSDVHFGQRYYDQENKKNGIKDEPELMGILNRALEIYKDRGAKFITNAGDLVKDNLQWEYDNYRKWVDAFVKENPKIDFYVCSGNHDVISFEDKSQYAAATEDSLGYEQFSALTGQSKYYTGDIVRTYHPENENYGFTIKYQGDLFIFLNTIKWTGTNMITQSQFDWVEELLDANTDNTVYLYFHWPISAFSGSYIIDSETYDKNGVSHTNTSTSSKLEDGYQLCTKMKSILKGRQNVVYISGHTHYSNLNQFMRNQVSGEYNYQININDYNDAYGPVMNVGSSAKASTEQDSVEETAESALMRVFDDRMVFESFDVLTMQYQAYATYVSDVASHKYDTTFIDAKYNGDVLESVNFTIEDDKKADVYFAMYHDERMIFSDKADYKEGGVYTLDIGKTIPTGVETKLFIWENGSNAPLCKSAIISK